MPSKISQINSPARDIMAVIVRAEKSGRRPSIPELKKIGLHAIDYLESRITQVEGIESLVSNGDSEALAAKIKRLSSKEDKSDDEYVALLSAERRVADVSAKSAKAMERATLAQEVLTRELMEWGSRLLVLLAEANSRDLFDELEKVLTPYMEDRPAKEVIINVPAYHSMTYRPLWISPTERDFMRAAVQGADLLPGTTSARGLIDALKIAINNKGIQKA